VVKNQFMRKVTISIIIVYYSADDIFTCIEAIRKSKPKTSYEIIVIDNSVSGSSRLKKVSGITYKKAPKNGGYGYGNNLGVQIAKGDYFFILNPDTFVTENTIDVLHTFLEKNRNAAIVGPNLLHEDGTRYDLMGSRDLTPLSGLVGHSFLNKLFPKNHVSKRYYLLDVSQTKLREVSSVPGCAFLIRSDVFRLAGGFDETIFLYYEEADLGKRVKELGYRLYITPEADVIHKKTFDNDPELKKYNVQSRFYYFKKHFGVLSALLVELFCRFSKKKAILVFVVTMIVLFVVYI
jgi:GT2 family glycosyltransferase